MRLEGLIFKSFYRRSRTGLLASILFFVSCLLIFAYLCYIICGREIKIRDSYELYGSYQISFDGLSREKALEIASDENVASASIYAARSYQTDGYMEFVYTDSNYFELSGFRLSSGRFPEKDDEVVCEEAYIWQMGYDPASSSGLTMELQGKTYTVVGSAVSRSSERVLSLYIPVFVFNIEGYSDDAVSFNLIANVGDRDFSSSAKELCGKYGISEDQLGYNYSAMSFSGVNENNTLSGIYGIGVTVLYAILIIFVFFILSGIVSMLSLRLEDISATYRLYGVRPKKLAFIYSLTIFVSSVTGGAFSLAVMCLFLRLYFNANSIECTVAEPLIVGVLTSLVISVTVSLASYFAFVSVSRKNKEVKRQNKKHRGDITKSRFPFLAIARRDVNSRSLSFVAGIVIAGMGIALYSSVTYVSDMIFTLPQNISEYDYSVEYYYSSIVEEYMGIEGLDEFYGKLELDTKYFSVFPSYSESSYITISKYDLSSDYVKFLKKISGEFNIAFDNNSSPFIDVEAVIVGVDDELMRRTYKMDLPSPSATECYIVGKTDSIDNTGFDTGLGINSNVKLKYNSTDKALTVSKIIDFTEFDLIAESYYMPVIFISLDNFKEISDRGYPGIVNIKVSDLPDAKEKTAEYFRGVNGIVLEDNSKEIRLVEREKLFITVFVNSITVLIGILVSLNGAVTAATKFRSRKKLFAALRAVGVSIGRVIISLYYDMIRSLILSLIIGVLLSAASLKIIAMYISSSRLGYFVFSFPWLNIIIPSTILAVITLFSMLPFFFAVKKMNIAKSLGSEA